MALTDSGVRNAQPKDKPYRLPDSKGLYLQVTPTGGRLWRMKYRYQKKEKLLSIGQYPSVSLAEARRRRDTAKEQLAEGIDPGAVKQESKRSADRTAGRTFEAVAREWFQRKEGSVVGTYASRIWTRVEQDLLPELGKYSIESIEPPEVLTTIRKIEDRGAPEMGRRVLNYASQIYRYAIASGYVKRDPTLDIRGALAPRKGKNRRAWLRETELAGFLDKLAEYDGDALTRYALELTLHTFVRTSETRFAVWDEFEKLHTPAAQWRIPAERMKMREPHIVPLTKQSVRILDQIKELDLRSDYLFPAATRSRVISENTMLYALYRMGYKSRATVHGFRTTASTVLNEAGFNRDWIERQLAHVEENEVRAAYNAAEYLPQRRTMMEWWSGYLEGRHMEDNVIIPFKAA